MKKQINNKIRVLGLMSGTSLDGLDLALCEFENKDGSIAHKIIKANTVSYSKAWKRKLESASQLNALDFCKLDVVYGKYAADLVNNFLKGTSIKPDLIASHGHTVFHRPELGFSTQIGNGATLSALTTYPTICDFRSLDVAMGGQGAPLVPIGDKLLFGKFQACLNIGGIANISYDKKGKRLAFDICPANMILNYLAQKAGKAYDKDGKIAEKGRINTSMLNRLLRTGITKNGPKSLGREWFEAQILPVLNNTKVSIPDTLATASTYIAQLIANELNKNKIQNVLITGGGTFNAHVISIIQAHTSCELIIPSCETINFKEALIFAFLGYLRYTGALNTLKSVTGASSNSSGGAIYGNIRRFTVL